MKMFSLYSICEALYRRLLKKYKNDCLPLILAEFAVIPGIDYAANGVLGILKFGSLFHELKQIKTLKRRLVEVSGIGLGSVASRTEPWNWCILLLGLSQVIIPVMFLSEVELTSSWILMADPLLLRFRSLS
jgi:hypothetical protein